MFKVGAPSHQGRGEDSANHRDPPYKGLRHAWAGAWPVGPEGGAAGGGFSSFTIGATSSCQHRTPWIPEAENSQAGRRNGVDLGNEGF